MHIFLGKNVLPPTVDCAPTPMCQTVELLHWSQSSLAVHHLLKGTHNIVIHWFYDLQAVRRPHIPRLSERDFFTSQARQGVLLSVTAHRPTAGSKCSAGIFYEYQAADCHRAPAGSNTHRSLWRLAPLRLTNVCMECITLTVHCFCHCPLEILVSVRVVIVWSCRKGTVNRYFEQMFLVTGLWICGTLYLNTLRLLQLSIVWRDDLTVTVCIHVFVITVKTSNFKV